MYPNWERDEYRALQEFCSDNNLSYEVLAISYKTSCFKVNRYLIKNIIAKIQCTCPPFIFKNISVE